MLNRPNKQGYTSPRRTRAYVSILGITQLHLRNPVIIAFWSAIFPGMGYMLLSKYIRGLLFFVWEIVVNQSAHLNMAIFHTFTGNFEQAKQVLDKRWLLLYIPMYLFVIWDSYRMAADMNNLFVLAAREDASIKSFILHPMGANYIDRGSPWTAAVWSMFSPGAGQLIFHRIIVAFFLVGWWVAVVYFSNVLPAIHYTFTGGFEQAKTVVNVQWLLNIPSILFFGVYDAYANSVESNKLFDWEQSKFLKMRYQSNYFPMPLFQNYKRGDNMHVVSTFEHTIKLEMAITAIEMIGIPKENILAVPMDKKNEGPALFDRVHYSDSLSLLDVPMISAAVFALLGLIYGFLLTWGPILWALIGTGAGFGIGLLLKLITTKERIKKNKGKQPEVVLLVACDDKHLQMVQDTLWAHSAIGVAKFDPGKEN